MGNVGTLVTIALPNIVSATARLRAGPIARSVVSARSVARPTAGIENLLTAVVAEVTLATIAGLPMVDARLPSVAAAGDGMRGPITRRGDIDVVAAPTPVDVA